MVDGWHRQDSSISGVDHERNKGFCVDKFADILGHNMCNSIAFTQKHRKVRVYMQQTWAWQQPG